MYWPSLPCATSRAQTRGWEVSPENLTKTSLVTSKVKEDKEIVCVPLANIAQEPFGYFSSLLFSFLFFSFFFFFSSRCYHELTALTPGLLDTYLSCFWHSKLWSWKASFLFGECCGGFITESPQKAVRVCERKKYRKWKVFSKIIARQHFRVVKIPTAF